MNFQRCSSELLPADVADEADELRRSFRRGTVPQGFYHIDGRLSSKLFADSHMLLKSLLIPEGFAAELAAEFVAFPEDLQGHSIVLLLAQSKKAPRHLKATR